MAFTVTDTSGSSVTLAKGDKITSIAGQSRELYIVGIKPWAQGRRRRARIVAPVDAVITPFIEVDSGTLAPTYDSAATVKAQVKTEKNQEYKYEGDDSDADYGPDAVESKEILYFNNSNTSQDFGLIRVELADATRGLMFAGLYTVSYIPEPSESGGDPDLYQAPTLTPGTPVSITPTFIQLGEQTRVINNTEVTMGDAVLKITRDQLTQAQILASKATFSITPLGGSAVIYQAIGSKGLIQEQSYHWTIYLKKVRT